ncbi:hypothetical protein AVEN_231905-1 [Araneus ventricosus]|uniref:Retrovirus-related Pol polyprotein from transposon 412 n=1 Tax=Araneus ventricosus TaxID=182803 RepID=A0A4Y2S3Q0_ARAVE|nr:hypothetical protein AVEN_85707-1 [Araneus ventricosus]GBN82507.1 hypothetical protein AVEN_22297-1 [Araneus ventricosus]GBN82543.1 hypothetical protein AVEN_231905-1 [Araneus ventricosus]
MCYGDALATPHFGHTGKNFVTVAKGATPQVTLTNLDSAVWSALSQARPMEPPGLLRLRHCPLPSSQGFTYCLTPLTGSSGGLKLCHLLTSGRKQLLKLYIVVGYPDSELLSGSPQTEVHNLRVIQFFVQQQPQAADNGFIKKLKTHIQQLRATPTSNHSAKSTFVYRDLSVCSHVFLRVDAVEPSLSQPYIGPYKVLSRTNKNFIILKDNKKVTVTIDRLKPTHLLLDNVNSSESKLDSPRVDTSSPTS